MTKNRATHDALTLARADHEALAAELKRMRDSLRATDAQLKLERRKGDNSEKMHALAADVSTLRVLVAGQEADVAEAAARVNELESAAEDEVILAEVARATVEYHEAERVHHELFAETEKVIAAAIARSDELKHAASAAKSRAKDAALKLAAKRDTDVGDALARAVVGSDVPSMHHDARITRWPHGNRQRYKLLAQIKPKTQGVTFGEEAGA